MKLYKVASVFTILFLSACSKPIEQPIEKIVVQKVQVQRPAPIVPSVDTLSLRPIQWVVVTENNYKEVFDKLKTEGRSPILFGLTDQGYRNFILNTSDTISVIRQYKEVIVTYKQSYLDKCC